jgi:RNA polymerase sigma factor (TIGR02999 family)
MTPGERREGEVTRLLLEWGEGDAGALERLVPLVYDELRRIAEKSLSGERPGHTLQPTAVVNEAFVRLIDQKSIAWKSRGHFFAIAARTMRRLLVDHARRRDAEKRGGASTRVALDEAGAVAAAPDADVLALDRALEKLAALDATQAKVVELHYFGGLTLEETAELLDTSPSSVVRAFRLAKAFLYRELSPP